MNVNQRMRTGDTGRSKISYLGVPLAGLALFGLAACGSPSASATSSDPGPSPAANGQMAANQAPGGANTAAKGFCESRDLRLSVTSLPSTAHTNFSRLEFRNVSGHSCVLRGYPGVSTVAGDDGHQVGHSAIRRPDFGPVSTVRLAPGGYAHARLEQVSTDAYSLARCAPRKVRGLRVYPPEETAAKYVPLAGDACSDGSVGRPQIGAITAGPRS